MNIKPTHFVIINSIRELTGILSRPCDNFSHNVKPNEDGTFTHTLTFRTEGK